MRRPLSLLAVVALALAALTGCSVAVAAGPRCGEWERLGLLAQAVPSAAYVPCVATLPAGWSSEQLEVRDGSASFRLLSDRADGRAVVVSLVRHCVTTGATPIPPRPTGGRSAIGLLSIRPRYAGTLFDVFPGGCITSRFDLPRGQHIALMADLERIVGLLARTRLRTELRDAGFGDPP